MKIKRERKGDDGIFIEEAIVRVEIIGYTRTGKKIYLDSFDIEHAFYNYQDHVDAEALHKTLRNTAYSNGKPTATEHVTHAHNHRKAGLLSVEDGFESACLNHTTQIHNRMNQLKNTA